MKITSDKRDESGRPCSGFQAANKRFRNRKYMSKPCQGDRACFCSVVIHNAYIGINNTIYLVKDEKIDKKK